MKTLHLNLKKEWFDLILSGEKKEEYRELTKYWESKLFDLGSKTGISFLHEDIMLPKKYDTITFSNGYSKTRRQIIVKYNGLDVGLGSKKWGAETNKPYYVLKLGEILETKNIK